MAPQKPPGGSLGIRHPPKQANIGVTTPDIYHSFCVFLDGEFSGRHPGGQFRSFKKTARLCFQWDCCPLRLPPKFQLHSIISGFWGPSVYWPHACGGCHKAQGAGWPQFGRNRPFQGTHGMCVCAPSGFVCTAQAQNRRGACSPFLFVDVSLGRISVHTTGRASASRVSLCAARALYRSHLSPALGFWHPRARLEAC